MSAGFNILVGAYSLIFYMIIPAATDVIGNTILSKKLVNKEILEPTYVGMKALGSIENFMKIWLFIATVLLISAYSMYWFKKKYGLEASE